MNKYVSYLICALFTCIMIKYIILSDFTITHKIEKDSSYINHRIKLDTDQSGLRISVK